MEKLKTLLKLFLAFLKIGLFTFGGGYAMIAVVEREIVSKKGWITDEEFTNLIAVAESTPGPIAINMATFVGYKKGGIFGAILATFGVVLPSFCIILLISLFFEKFKQLTYVKYAFMGIEVCVGFIIICAGVKMFLKLKKTVFNCVMFALTVCVMLIFSLFSIAFSSVYYILIGAFLGVAVYVVCLITKKGQNRKENTDENTDKETTENIDGNTEENGGHDNE